MTGDAGQGTLGQDNAAQGTSDRADSRRRFIDLEIDASGTLPLDSVGSIAAAAEAAGFGGIWKGETSNRDPAILLAAAATATQRIALGSAILHVLARSPVACAMLAASLAELSGGRFILGLGVANPTLAGWHGSRFARPLDMARDYVDIVRRALAGERVAVNGRAFSSQDFRLAGPARPVRIVLAALGPKMSALAGAIADGVIINLANPAAIARIVGQVHAGARAAGRDPAGIEVAVKVRVAIADDLAAARAALRPTVAIYTRAPGYRGLLVEMGFADTLNTVEAAWQAGGFGAAIRAIPDAMLDQLPTLAARSVSDLRGTLAPYRAAGATRILIPIVPVGKDAAAETRAFIDGYARATID